MIMLGTPDLLVCPSVLIPAADNLKPIHITKPHTAANGCLSLVSDRRYNQIRCMTLPHMTFSGAPESKLVGCWKVMKEWTNIRKHYATEGYTEAATCIRSSRPS